MTKKKTNPVEPADKPKRRIREATDAPKTENPKRKKTASKKTNKSKLEDVKVTQPAKVEWRESINPYNLSDYYTEDPEEINLISLLELLSETEDERCDFEVDETVGCDNDDLEHDSWLREIESRFEAVVGPLIVEDYDIYKFNNI